MTQDALAYAAETSQNLISEVEAGLANPQLDTLIRIAAALDTNLVILARHSSGAMESSSPRT